jgi:hypothetical protein
MLCLFTKIASYIYKQNNLHLQTEHNKMHLQTEHDKLHLQTEHHN